MDIQTKMDIELLICMVRDRPALWDKTCNEYKSRSHSRDAWAEICMAFYPDFQTTSLEEQQIIQTRLVKKWGNVRDSWMRWRRNLGDKNKQVRRYIYSEKLEFLQNISSNEDSHSPNKEDNSCNGTKSRKTSKTNNSPPAKPNPPLPVQNKSPSPLPVPLQSTPKGVPPPAKRKAIDCKNMNGMECENRHLSFFKSVLPSMVCFTDDETLEFQMGVLSSIQGIKKRRLKMA